MSTPHFAAFATPDATSAMAADVAASLMATPRRVPSRYLYDSLGSALFEAICELPWYRVTQAELSLLERHGAAVLAASAPVGRVVELGAGSGRKLSALLQQRRLATAPRISLIDVSPTALISAHQALGQIDGLGPILLHEQPYEEGLRALAHEPEVDGRTLLLFLGSNLGNFEPAEGGRLLRRIRAALQTGDRFLLGTDLVKPQAMLQLAYDDPLGVTAAFNRNLFVRLNRELGANFDVRALQHVAVWNAEASRMEMHVESTEPQSITVPAAGIRFTLDAGERIWTESSYKYTPIQIAPMLATAGFRQVDQWIDRHAGFALTLASPA